MRLRILEPIERKARAAIKSRPEFRRLERKKNFIAKGVTAGRYSPRQGKDLMRLLRCRRRLLVVREMQNILQTA